MSYGYRTNPDGPDPLVSLADEVMADIFSKSCVFGNWTVDVLPFGSWKFYNLWELLDIYKQLS